MREQPLNKHKIRLPGSVKIVPFTGFGNRKLVYVSGLVVAKNGISKPSEGAGKWSNIKSMIRRYTANEIENAQVRIAYKGDSKVVTTDKYGIYRCAFSNKGPDGDIWQNVSVTLESPPKFSHAGAEGEVMIVNNNPQFSIISDIDDTILVSYATQKLMKLRLMLLNNAHTRMPFEGVSAFYNALQAGTGGNDNPIFYVSNSEWNLYDLLYEFIQHNRIPKGPLLLREMAIRVLRPWAMKEVNRHHKVEVIMKLFRMYPDQKFILIGDSGQRDPEIYSEIVKQFPGRVLAIYIRDVGISGNLPVIRVLTELMMNKFSTEMVLVRDTEAAARHAIQNGFISSEYFESVIRGKQADIESKMKPAEKLL
jgi:phosphatidate phosphatase APP1